MDQAVQQLIEFLKQASPVVWQALIRQVYVEAGSMVFWGIVSAVGIWPMGWPGLPEGQRTYTLTRCERTGNGYPPIPHK